MFLVSSELIPSLKRILINGDSVVFNSDSARQFQEISTEYCLKL